MLLRELAETLKATLHPGLSVNADSVEIRDVAPVAKARAGDISFVVSADFERYLTSTQASAVIVDRVFADLPIPQLVHRNPYWAFAKTAQIFHPPVKRAPGVSPQAVVAADAQVDPSATVMPYAVVGHRAKIGKGAVIFPHVYVGDDVEIGAATEIRASVVLEAGVRIGDRVLIHGGTVIGADGFGFAPGEGELAKIPQIGTVVIADDVEIGAAVTIDRGALDDTVIGRGTKLDSNVHVGHGATVGENSILCGVVGVAGSARIGNWVMIGGHAAVNNKCHVPDGSQIGAMSGVTKSLPEKGVYMGFPAQPAGEWRRQIVAGRRLPELEKRLRDLEAKLKELSPPAP